jgi:PAS domain S-box-containing protein
MSGNDNLWETRLAALCGAVAALAGVAVLVGWWLDLSALKSVFPGFVSMKGNTALAFVLAGVALVQLSGMPIPARRAAVGRWLALLVALIGALTLCEYLFGWSLGIDELLFKDEPDAAATLVAGRMAPSTAVCFVLLGLALIGIEWEPRPSFRPAEPLALLAAFVSLISLAEYVVGAPILYGFSEYTRMAPHTATVFVLLCAGVLLARPKQGLVGALRAGRISRFDQVVYAALLLVLLALFGAGGWFYRSQEQQSRSEVETELDTVARLKVAQIVQWRNQRLGDAAALTSSAFLSEGVARWMATAQTADAGKILQRFAALQQYGHYQEVLLVDARGQVRLSTSGRVAALAPEESLSLVSALREMRATLGDLHTRPGELAPHINSIAPIVQKNGAALVSVGAVILISNARDFLYPLIQSWPTPSASAETLLVRRDGDSALFLNDIRHQSNTALTLRIPLSQQQVPAVMAALGKEGVFRGVDYRGVKVLSFLYAIPDSPWFMVTKIDETEALAQWRRRADLIVVLLTVLVLAIIGVTLMLWRQAKITQMLRNSTQELGKANRAYHVLSECNQSLVHASNEQQLLDRICSLLVEHGGYRCAWVGYAEHDAKKSVRAVAEHGFEAGYVQSLHLTWADAERGCCPTGSAIRDGQNCLARSTESGAAYDLWRKGAVRHGYASSISLPLKFNGSAGGALSIYATDAQAFSPQEVALLTEMADDLAFGIRSLRSKATRERAEAQLRLQASALDAAANSIVITDRDASILWVNRAFCALTGYSTDEAIGQNPRLLKSGAQDGEFYRSMYQTLLAGSVWHGEIINRYKDGRLATEDMTITPLCGDDGRITHFIAIKQDITERKRAERQARESLLYARSLLEASLDPLVTISAEGKITDVNEASVKVTGIAREALVGTDFSEYFTEPQKAREGYQQVFTKGFVMDYPLTIRHRDGRLAEVLYNASVYKNAAGEVQGVFAAARDITEMKRSEQVILDLNATLERRVAERTAQLEEANRAKSDFLANMSHELRTPLNAIIGFSELLKDGVMGELQAKQQEFVGDIFGAGTHLLALINDILDLSKVEAGMLQLELGTVELASLLQASTTIVREKAAAHSIRLETRLDQTLGNLLADERKLKQIVYNLLSNAIKFTPEGGAVTLWARRCTRAEVGFDEAMSSRLLPLPAGDDGEFVEIAIEDSGSGILEADLQKLYQPFMQLDSAISRSHGGTGLGLSLVRRLAELHGGTVGVASRPGTGSRFCVWLPCREATAVAQVSSTPEGAVSSGSGAAIPSAPAATALSRAAPPLALVIEDDDQAADLIAAQLHLEGFQVMRAATGEEALVRAAKRRPQLITLDIFLPAMDGWEFLRHLKADQRLADTPVVIISVANGLERGLALGARRILQKPFLKEELVAALAGLMPAPLPGASAGAPPRVLVVDDNMKAVEMVATLIEHEGYHALRAYSGAEAIQAARAARPDLVILDLMMPDVSGFEVARALRASKETARIPILVLTAKDLTPEERERLNGAVGAILQKSQFSHDELLAELRRAIAVSKGA